MKSSRPVILFMVLALVGSLCMTAHGKASAASPRTPVVLVAPNLAGKAAQYTISFQPSVVAVVGGDGITIEYPLGSTIPTAIDPNNVAIATSGTPAIANPPAAGVSVNGRSVYVQIPSGYGVTSSGTMTITITQLAGIRNPPVSSQMGDGIEYRIKVSTTPEPAQIESAAYTIDAWVTANPMALALGQPVTITGAGFKPATSVDVSGGATGHAGVQSNGTFAVIGVATGLALPITATDGSGRSAEATFGADVLPRIQVFPDSGRAGSPVTIIGFDFSGTPTAVTIGSIPVDATGMRLADIDGDGIGDDFKIETVVPASLTVGTKTVAVRDTDGDIAEGSFTVAPAEPVPVTPELGFASISDYLRSSWSFDAEEQEWRFYSPTVLEHVNDLDWLIVGQTYWLNVVADCVLVYGVKAHNLKVGWNLIDWVG